MTEGSSADHSLSTMTALGFRLCFFTASSEARMTHDAPSVICELLPGVTLPHGRSNAGLSLARLSARAVRPHAVVVVEQRAVAREGRLDLVLEVAFLLRARQPVLALGGIFDRPAAA